jgi:hypothetical protein
MANVFCRAIVLGVLVAMVKKKITRGSGIVVTVMVYSCVHMPFIHVFSNLIPL